MQIKLAKGQGSYPYPVLFPIVRLVRPLDTGQSGRCAEHAADRGRRDRGRAARESSRRLPLLRRAWGRQSLRAGSREARRWDDSRRRGKLR
jgi:hypothetical protein